MDLNNLRFTNDNYDHGQANLLTQTAARIIRDTFGKNTFRIGSEEVVAFATDVDEAQLKVLFDQMNQAMVQEHANGSVEFSHRRAHVRVQQQEDIADKAMYEQKLLYRSRHNIG
ncbi:MAG: hypothetical protein E7319_10075 [Clostridiales bacterium]|nr:hypothetical protein [Clostridiales bacterium]